jgi:TatD DNase family protein
VQFTDTHCHLPSAGGDDAIADAQAEAVTRLITIGTDATESAAAIAVAERHEGVWATVGLHPHEARHGVASIRALLGDDRSPTIVAVGECGLDYHYDHSPREVQRSAFAEQIELAHRLDLALVIHTREAWDDTFAILDEVGVPERTVFHCFTGGPREAERCVERGAFVSFSGIVSFPKAVEVREAAARVPAERLLIETDAPYLAPVPHRGRPNRPSLLPSVATAVAAARRVAIEEVAQSTWDAADLAFRLEPSLA